MNDATPAPEPPDQRSPESLADILPLRVQAGLFVLLAALLGVIAWKAWQPAPIPVPTRPALVDLNRADRETITALHGVGPELAERIVAYRSNHGSFESLADLRKVSGIGPAKLEQIRPQVSLSWPVTAPTSEPRDAAIVPAALERKPAAGPILDLNTATLAELRDLPGIGPVKAQRILDRRAQAPFRDVNELRKISGIGTKTFDGIKSRLAIGDGAARIQ